MTLTSSTTDVTAEEASSWLRLAVVGAHLTGLARHPELVARQARLVERTRTAPCYRLYRLADGLRPGLLKVASGGYSIEVELYELPLTEVGAFLRNVVPPLAIGTVELASGESVSGFVCEPIGIDEGTDISEFGGWRAYLEATAVEEITT